MNIRFFEVKFTYHVNVAARLMNMWNRAVNSKEHSRASWNKVRMQDARIHWDACLDAQEEVLKVC